jgi:iron(III) transport system substrate-binding protein
METTMSQTKRTILKGAAFAVIAAAGLSATAAPVLADSLPERFADLYAAAKADGEVVFYTSYRQETSTEVLAFWKKNFPDSKLNIVQKQTLDLIPTIEAEKAAGRTNPDVVFISQRYVIDDWAKRGYIEPYKTKAAAKIDPKYQDPSGNYIAVGISLLSAAYNPKAFPDTSVLPKKITDFLDPKWKGRIVFGDPKSAASQLTWFQTLLAKKIIDWDTIKGFAAQDFLFTRGNAESVRLLVAGERDLSPLISSQNVITAREKGQSIELYILDEGVVVNENLLTIFKGGPHPNAAKLLVDVLASPEGQELTAASGSYLPTHPDAASPAGLPLLKDIKTIDSREEIGGKASQDFLAQFDEVFDRS